MLLLGYSIISNEDQHDDNDNDTDTDMMIEDIDINIINKKKNSPAHQQGSRSTRHSPSCSIIFLLIMLLLYCRKHLCVNLMCCVFHLYLLCEGEQLIGSVVVGNRWLVVF